jgi:integrase
MFPLTRDLRRVLEAQRERTSQVERATGQIIPWVFHRQGRPIKNFKRAWISACLAAGFAEVVSVKPRRVRLLRIPHDFRRTAVRNLERAGVPRSTAMKMVGHKTEAIYRRYAIVDEAMLQEGAAKLDRLQAEATRRDEAGSATVTPIRQDAPFRPPERLWRPQTPAKSVI